MAASFIALAVVARIGVWIHDPARTLVPCPTGCAGDEVQSAWFLAAVPHLLLQGHNPLFTDWLDYPSGVNMVQNPSMTLLGLLAAPVTLTAGPVVTLNALLVLAVAGSALGAFLLFRRWVAWGPAAYAGALVFGFGPYATGQARDHLDLTVTLFPLIALWLGDQIVVRQTRPAWQPGLALGVAGAAQLLVSAEILATTTVMGSVGLVLLGSANRDAVVSRTAHAARAFGVTVVTFGILAAYPLWMLFRGPAHLSGPVQSSATVTRLASDLLGPIVPGSNQLLDPGLLHGVATRLTLSPSMSEDGVYLGAGLITVLIWTAVRRRRDGRVRFTVAMGVVALVLSLGGRLVVAGHTSAVRLPFRVLVHLPVLDNALASRFSLYTDLFAGMLLALGLDSLRPSVPGRPWVPAAAAVVALVPLLPAWPYPTASLPVPAFFTGRAVDRIPAGTTLLTFPYPGFPNAEAMAWQALDGMRYRLLGGYAFYTGPRRSVADGADPALVSRPLQRCVGRDTAAPRLSADRRRRIIDELGRLKVSTIVVTGVVPGEHCAVTVVTSMLGRAPRAEDGVYVWFRA